jgi:hypothetical protein
MGKEMGRDKRDKRKVDKVRRKLLRIGIYSAPVILSSTIPQFSEAATAAAIPVVAPPVGKIKEEDATEYELKVSPKKLRKSFDRRLEFLKKQRVGEEPKILEREPEIIKRSSPIK